MRLSALAIFFFVGLIRGVGSSLPETRGGMFHHRSAAPQKSQHIPHLAKNCRPHSTTLRHGLEDHVVAHQAGPKSGRLFEHGNTQVAGNPQNSQHCRTDVQSSRACAGDRIDRRARIDGALLFSVSVQPSDKCMVSHFKRHASPIHPWQRMTEALQHPSIVPTLPVAQQ